MRAFRRSEEQGGPIGIFGTNEEPDTARAEHVVRRDGCGKGLVQVRLDTASLQDGERKLSLPDVEKAGDFDGRILSMRLTDQSYSLAATHARGLAQNTVASEIGGAGRAVASAGQHREVPSQMKEHRCGKAQ